MDVFLSAIKQSKSTDDLEQLAELYKSVNKVKAGGPSEEARVWFSENNGKQVRINNCDMEGTVTGLNERTRGFYPGDRYPIYVVITKDTRIEHNANGMKFEYDLEQLIVI